MNIRTGQFYRAVILLIGGVIGVSLCVCLRSAPRPIEAITPSHSPGLPDVYVWQRNWTPQVYDAISQERRNFRSFVILAAEINLRGNTQVADIHTDYSKLVALVHQIGIAIRIGPLPAASADALNPDSLQTALICQTAVHAIATARQMGMGVTELQLDFDCAESKLAGYANWVKAVKNAISPVPVVITALPSWLKHHEFADLARIAGSYVLQVHSLHQPTGPDSPLLICDADEARRAVGHASEIGVPFRVALPTYTYLAGFSSSGKFIGLSAEGPLPSWPTGTILRVMRPDPDSLANLVRIWSTDLPKAMTGIIWYRLPVAGDSMNWRSATLYAVMSGRDPKPNVTAQALRTQPALFDLYLQNAGDADADMALKLTAICTGAKVVAADAIDGFQQLDAPPGSVTFSSTSVSGQRWIAPGERIQVGWLRLSADTEVQTNVSPISP